jgi:hypothetical protein
VRIGTWNLAGRWGDEHRSFLVDLDCDVLLLTEVSERVDVPGHTLHVTKTEMALRRRWAGVLVRGDDLMPLPDPHPASAMATSRGWTFCSSILPWKGAGNVAPWVGTRHADWTAGAVETLLASLPTTGLVWGGDWNHAMTGREYAGSKAGRAHICQAVTQLRLRVPTSELAHRIAGLVSIDHVAVPVELDVVGAYRIDASGPPRLSDHDAYVVELADLADLARDPV